MQLQNLPPNLKEFPPNLKDFFLNSRIRQIRLLVLSKNRWKKPDLNRCRILSKKGELQIRIFTSAAGFPPLDEHLTLTFLVSVVLIRLPLRMIGGSGGTVTVK